MRSLKTGLPEPFLQGIPSKKIMTVLLKFFEDRTIFPPFNGVPCSPASAADRIATENSQ
jgi:hypothetical protein